MLFPTMIEENMGCMASLTDSETGKETLATQTNGSLPPCTISGKSYLND